MGYHDGWLTVMVVQLWGIKRHCFRIECYSYALLHFTHSRTMRLLRSCSWELGDETQRSKPTHSLLNLQYCISCRSRSSSISSLSREFRKLINYWSRLIRQKIQPKSIWFFLYNWFKKRLSNVPARQVGFRPFLFWPVRAAPRHQQHTRVDRCNTQRWFPAWA